MTSKQAATTKDERGRQPISVTIVGPRERPVSCRGCQQPTFDPEALCTTCRNRRGETADPFKCVECGHQTTTLQGAGRHEAIVHDGAQTMWRLSQWTEALHHPSEAS